MQSFVATAAAALEIPDSECFLVAFAEHPEGDGKRLEIAVLLELSEYDIACGQDTYSLATESGACAYGGVTSWHVDPGCLVINVDGRTAQALEIVDGFRIQFPEVETATIITGLERVLGRELAV